MATIEKKRGKILKCLRSDRGGELTSNEFEMFCNDKEIKRQTFVPRTPPQNWITKRRNRSIMECTRRLMIEENVALKYQREFVSTIFYTLNLVQVKTSTHSTPFELWYGYSPNILRYLEANALFSKKIRNGKLDTKSEEGIFLGYSTRSKDYKCLNTSTNKVVESVNVKFNKFKELYEDELMKEPK